ncbi:hypothetical protein [Bradyrhizobium viridifuturi]|uniref:hypothetical protein n=1 Tax=Bradyrhizobium viridifuturi TaxID=1654716 RepID=UPI0007C75A1E|nr:hypothetical protein [Bradyrhizobium viridifuturi]
MTANPTMPLDDVLYAFAMARPIPDPGTLEEFTRKYPAYADELTDFAVDLLLDSAIEDEVGEADDDDSVSPAVSRAISHFQNALYELEKKPVPALQAVPQTKNPFADMDRTRFRSVARGLNANNTFLIKLRDRTIEPDTVTSRIGSAKRSRGKPASRRIWSSHTSRRRRSSRAVSTSNPTQSLPFPHARPLKRLSAIRAFHPSSSAIFSSSDPS